MSRADLMKLAERENYKATYPFGGESPTFDISGTNYTLGFCEDQLTYASWMISTNEELIKSINKRQNEEGFRLVRGVASVSYDDATKNELSQLSLDLRHPENATAYSVEYTMFEHNSQIDLIDTRFDDSLNCTPEA